ncbi:cyclase family protein [Campylobacter hyointestinalis]|uniref:Cyclase n=1 Tax=Campylobacter hyointestinalis TaxID=198 RepID=A0A562XER9_CAMHY|nr:cyclase family protein [Campylobacter hyointestinalis]RAZ45673.1 cyclase [Campylobacter hyointestinalis subsp. lawsonii]TWO20631.1 cyclase [Campylobacter hyointestinalis]
MTKFLSYILDENTPTYGNRDKILLKKRSSILNGDIANNTYISTTLHIGTHIDMPYHFYENGQTIVDFDASFWIFDNVLFIDVQPRNLVIENELLSRLDDIEDIGYDILIVKTGICDLRDKDIFWSQNYGFSPKIYNYLSNRFPNIRVFGFDSISVSSFSNRALGRESHKAFLNPNKPILLLEDMDLRSVGEYTKFKEIIISPLRVAKCDGLPCAVLGKIYD